MNLMPFKGGRNETQSLLPSNMLELKNEMDRVFERFFGRGWSYDAPEFFGALSTGQTGTSFGDWAPALDISESDREVVVKAELPGVDPKKVDVSVTGEVLTIRGEKSEDTKEEKTGYVRTERRFGSFERRIALPQHADPSKVTANFLNGVLTVRIDKKQGALARKVTVTQGGAGA